VLTNSDGGLHGESADVTAPRASSPTKDRQKRRIRWVSERTRTTCGRGLSSSRKVPKASTLREYEQPVRGVRHGTAVVSDHCRTRADAGACQAMLKAAPRKERSRSPRVPRMDPRQSGASGLNLSRYASDWWSGSITTRFLPACFARYISGSAARSASPKEAEPDRSVPEPNECRGVPVTGGDIGDEPHARREHGHPIAKPAVAVPCGKTDRHQVEDR
jgi:hypothetical protein